MNQQNRIATLVNSKFYPLLLFSVSFVFVVLFSRSTSFLYVYEGFDAAIFKQMGLALLRGKTLYIDYFDNKGFILYFINALGLGLGGNFAILLLQTLSLTITLLIWDKTLALYIKTNKVRLICLGTALVLLLCFYDGGDLCEEWCLPFASYPILVYFRNLISKKEIRFREMFVIGICFGIIAFIRINNAVSFLGYIAYSWILLLIKNDFNRFFKSLTCFLFGFIVILGVVILYFYIKAGWYGVNEMIYATFFSNFEYLGTKYIRMTFLYVFYYLFISLCIIQQIINSHKDKSILIPSLISYALFILTFGTRCFTHYLMSLLPLLVVLLMTTKFERHKKKNIVFYGLGGIAVFFYLPIPLAFTVNDLILKNDKYSIIYADFHHCIERIPVQERDSICNYNLMGSGTSMLLHEGLIQSNKVCVSSLTINIPKLWNKSKNQVTAPKWILVSWDKFFIKDDAYFIFNNYDLIYQFHYDRIYLHHPQIGNEYDVYLYCRKD